MQFNSETNGQDICTLADTLAKSNSKSFPIKKKVLYANMGLREIWGLIFEAYGGWHYDDSNQTDEPEATTILRADEQQVTLPLDSAHLMGVAYKDQSGSWHPLIPITIEQIQDRGYAESEFMNTSGNPQFYRPVADGFKMYPAANFTQNDSIKAWFSRDISTFSITDTNKVPGFPQEFHEGLAIYMAMQHTQTNTLPQAGGVLKGGFRTGLVAKWGDFSARITSFYGNRFRQLFPPRIRHSDVVRDYI